MRSLFPIAMAMALAFAALAACGTDDNPGEPAGPGAECGGRENRVCGADLYCDFGNNRCGGDDATGRCMPRPESCPALLVPERTCGCDGRVYSSACEATLAGADLNESATCELDSGAFACGYRQCSLTNQLCQRTGSDVAGVGDDFTCRGLPTACQANPTCACLAGEACGDRCTGDGRSGLTVTCPGG